MLLAQVCSQQPTANRETTIVTEKVFYQDRYLRELSATVTGAAGAWVTFDKTIFYPEGGGQPGDTGNVQAKGKALHIIDTRKGENPDDIEHLLDTEDHGLVAGDEVRMSLDWERRYRHMRMHTCMHLVSALVPVPVTGGSVGAEKSRLDFDLGEHSLDKEDLTTRLNALIASDAPILFENLTDAELDANPGLVRTMSVEPPRGSGVIRMVRIKDIDFQPCGGTHVNSIGEIGAMRVAKIENKGKRNRRVHLVFADA